MARAASLPSLGLSPFGGGGSGFDAFSIGAAKSEKAYLALRKVEVQWEAGAVSNADYLAALTTYAGTIKANTSERVSADARVAQYTYRFKRDVIEADVKSGAKTKDDLLAFDLEGLKGLNPTSEEYAQRLSQVNSDQNAIFNDLQDEQQNLYNDGKITAQQLLTWYKGLRSDLTMDNKELVDNIKKTTDNLADRVVDERDSKMLSDFSKGKVTPSSFLAYAETARARFTKGTPQYDDWTGRIDDAKDQSIEDSILYRYDLSQRYATLQKFIKDHGTAPTGSTSKGRTSTSTRIIWDGTKWVTKTVTSHTPGKYSGPSASEVQAWKKLQIEVADAKKEAAEIAKKVGTQAGGWVTTDDMIGYYRKMQGRYAVGTQEWYAVQGKLDGLNQQKHAESVLSKEGIRISYPKVKSEGKEYGSGGSPGLPTVPTVAASLSGGPKTASTSSGAASSSSRPGGSSTSPAAKPPAGQAGDRTLTIDEFMKGIAKVESGGRYDALNSSSGAYGKYQIMPSSWRGWAKKWLGDANAKPTPENQEKVAKKQMAAMYAKLGDWRAVAHAWYTGDYTKDPAKWSSGSTSYVNKVFGKLGMSPTKIVTMTPAARPAAAGASTPTSSTGLTPAKLAALPSTAAGKNPLSFPRGLDGRVFEDFYDNFVDAWKNGEESFTDYSTGRAVSYFIPGDVDTRTAIMEELDDRRVDYYVTKSKAYLNPDGSPTSGSIYAASQAHKSIVDAAENLAVALTFTPEAGKIAAPRASNTAVGRNDALHASEGFGEIVNVPGSIKGATGLSTSSVAGLSVDPSIAVKSKNALAKGAELSNKLDMQLAQLAAAAKRAYDNGDFNLAYGLNQSAVNLVATARPTLDAYLTAASGQLSAIQRASGTVPGAASSDFKALKDQVDELSSVGTSPSMVLTGRDPNADPALQLLDEVAGDLKSILQLDSSGEPVRNPDDASLTLKQGVNLLWKNGKLVIDTTTPQAIGYTSPTSKAAAGKFVQLGAVKVGNGVKGNVNAEYETGIIGFVGGSENYPVYGKIVAGVDSTGKSYQWAEDPISGGWYSITNQPLNIRTPAGFQAVATGAASTQAGLPKAPGAGQMSYQFESNGKKYQLAFDGTDSKYVLMEYQDGGPFGQSQWAPVGKIGAGKNDDLTAIIQASGLSIDMTTRNGEDKVFSNTPGPIVGMTASEWTDSLSSAGAKWSSAKVGQKYNINSFKLAPDATPASVTAKLKQSVKQGFYGQTDRIDSKEAAAIAKVHATGNRPTLVTGEITKAKQAQIDAADTADRVAEANWLIGRGRSTAASKAYAAANPPAPVTKPAAKPLPGLVTGAGTTKPTKPVTGTTTGARTTKVTKTLPGLMGGAGSVRKVTKPPVKPKPGGSGPRKMAS